jgi:formiminotetrahydrofolate cyclodeaminase
MKLYITITIFVLVIAVSVILAYLCRMLRRLISSKNENILYENYQNSFKLLDEAIKSSVVSINKGMVNDLKAAGSFYQMNREEAFLSCRNNITNIMNEKGIKNIGSGINDINSWIDDRIEYYVKKLKNYN